MLSFLHSIPMANGVTILHVLRQNIIYTKLKNTIPPVIMPAIANGLKDPDEWSSRAECVWVESPSITYMYVSVFVGVANDCIVTDAVCHVRGCRSRSNGRLSRS